MMNEIFIASVTSFNRGEPDKNGLQPVMLIVVAGKCPNRNVLSGTVASNMGIEVGKSYLFNVREVEPDEYGRKFSYTILKEVSFSEILEGVKTLGKAQVIEVSNTVKVSEDINKEF